MKKAFVICVIILFLGVGFQPALANEVSTTNTSDIEEDCDECQPINRVELLRVRLLLIRLEVFTNIILSKFGHIPEVAEKCEEVLDIISLGIQSKFLDKFCKFLENLYDSYFELWYSIINVAERLVDRFPFLEYYLNIIIEIIFALFDVIFWPIPVLGIIFCWPFP